MLNPVPFSPDAAMVSQAIGALYSMDDTDPLFEEVYEYWEQEQARYRTTNYSKAMFAEEYEMLENHVPDPKSTTERMTFAEMKERINVVQYAERFAELKLVGGKYKTQCFIPGHEDGTASLWIYPKTNSFYCFGCRRGGDVIDLVKLMGDNPREVAI